jgi:hypothetical protein
MTSYFLRLAKGEDVLVRWVIFLSNVIMEVTSHHLYHILGSWELLGICLPKLLRKKDAYKRELIA